MVFDEKHPLRTDPALVAKTEVGGYAWLLSKQPSVYYAWLQPVAEEVEFHPNLEPLEIILGFGVILHVYYGPIKQEMLYRLIFTDGFPSRLLLKPDPYCLFWSFGNEGGQSRNIKYHYRDRYLSLHEWTDKGSFLAVLRQQHYENNLTTIWTR
jgi:hypothetical protein